MHKNLGEDSIRCALLGLDRLELRRLRADLILCYKIIRGLVLLSPDSFFFKFVCSSRTRGHSFKLFYQIQRLIVDSIFSRVLRIWNSLPEDVVSAAHLSLFISSLVRQFKSVSDRQDVGALMCSVFTYLDLHY